MNKKQVKIIASLILLLTIVVCTYNNFLNKNEEIVLNKEEQTKTGTTALSMMYETEAGSGKYEESNESTWPGEGYIFNETLSKCEQGGILTWDKAEHKVYLSTNKSDKCYVYFDKLPDITLLTDYIKGLYTTDGENGLYLHDADLANGANDGSYRYAGADPNNYVCFGSDAATCPTDNLYRIIGVFGDQVKLIKYDYATSDLLGTDGDYYGTFFDTGNVISYYKGSISTYSMGSYYWNNSTQTSTWSESLLNKTNLNTNFLKNIGSTWANKIATTTWKVGGNTSDNIVSQNAPTAYTNEITSPATNTTYSAKIGLMYVSEYMYGASPTYWTYPGYNSSGASYDYRAATRNNWIYMGLDEWTVTRSHLLDYAFVVGQTGYIHESAVERLEWTVRPSFSLESSIIYAGGSGKSSDPIRIN